MVPLVIIKRFTDWSIKFKLLVITALLILSSVFLESFLSYNQYTLDFENQSTDRVQQIIEQVSLNIDAYLDDLSRLSVAPYRNDAVMEALDQNLKGSEMEQLLKTRLIEDFLDEIMIIPRNDILTVFVLTDRIYSSGRVQTNIDSTVDFRDFDWYREALTTQKSILVPAHLQQIVKNPQKTVFSIVKQIRSTKDTEKILGVIKVDANYSGIEAICNKVDMGVEGGLFIIDGNDNMIFSSIKGGHEDNFYKMLRNGEKTNITVNVDDQAYLVNSTHIARSNWTVVAINAVAELNEKALQTRNKAFLMAVISSFLAIVVLFLFIKKFLNPLLMIVKLMKEINHGNLSVTFPDKRNDEIGYLGSSFNEMVHRIKDMLEKNTQLVSEVYEANFLQKEAQINALFNQIRPHFIFNTLNMISLLMQSGQQEKAIDHINKLSSILRSMATWDKEVTIQQEITLLNAYLSIQSSRFDGRLEYRIDIDPSLHSYLIPALLFQPAVENAVIHGCEVKKQTTVINIYNKEEEDTLLFYIEDNGKGMDSTALEKLRHQVETFVNNDEEPPIKNSSKGTGIGLINVNRRIKMKYGPAYGLTIDSTLDAGTRITITLPKNHPKGENHIV